MSSNWLCIQVISIDEERDMHTQDVFRLFDLMQLFSMCILMSIDEKVYLIFFLNKRQTMVICLILPNEKGLRVITNIRKFGKRVFDFFYECNFSDVGAYLSR